MFVRVSCVIACYVCEYVYVIVGARLCVWACVHVMGSSSIPLSSLLYFIVAIQYCCLFFILPLIFEHSNVIMLSVKNVFIVNHAMRNGTWKSLGPHDTALYGGSHMAAAKTMLYGKAFCQSVGLNRCPRI